MITEQTTWNDNKRLMAALWPKWKPSDEEARLLNQRWGSLKQHILKTCIENHRFVRQAVPDVTAIHREYCTITTVDRPVIETKRRMEEVRGPSAQEVAEWDAWATEYLKTVTQAEIRAACDRIGLTPRSPRLLAETVRYCREHPRPVTSSAAVEEEVADATVAEEVEW